MQELRNGILVVFLLLCVVVRGQEDIVVGSKYSLYSEVLGEKRDYMVYLPDDYKTDATKRYRVVYLLDAESFYVTVVGMIKGFSKLKDKTEESAIVVGVVSAERTRDFTPTASNCGRNGLADNAKPKVGGGAEKFYQFLAQELKPEIEQNYRTDESDVLMGHSYSGLFALYAMFNHGESFDKVIAIDPSLWWDCGIMLEEIKRRIVDEDYDGKYLYIGLSAKKRTDRADDIIGDLAQELYDSILPTAKNLEYHFKTYPEENHGTVAVPGFYDGLKQIYRK